MLTCISDKGSAFMSHVIKEMADVHGNTQQQATTKHAQTIGVLERTQASRKKTFMIGTCETRYMWHKYVNIAVLTYNNSYHTSIGCQHSRVFHGCVRNTVLELNKGIRPQKRPTPNSQTADVLKQTEMIFRDVPNHTIISNKKRKMIKKNQNLELKKQQYV